MNANLDTKDLSFWHSGRSAFRETSKWSQEALAQLAGLDVRTIKRIEAGQPVSVTTRRALARAPGYTNPDVFENPEFIKGVHALFDGLRKVQEGEVQKQFPDHMRLSVARVTTGDGLARLAYEANAYLFNAEEAIASEAK